MTKANRASPVPALEGNASPRKGPSPKLARMLADLTPQQVEEATRITANLLALRAARRRAEAESGAAPLPGDGTTPAHNQVAKPEHL